jgi:hypothetical protein
VSSSTGTRSIIYLGLDVHKDSVTIAVLPADASGPTRIDTYPNDFAKLRRVCERLAKDGELRARYEASGAGYVLQRAMHDWGYHRGVIAPSLIPVKPRVQRKHDKHDAGQLARVYRAGELTTIRIPSEAEERVRDIVRCRETLQREVVKSRHYIHKRRDNVPTIDIYYNCNVSPMYPIVQPCEGARHAHRSRARPTPSPVRRPDLLHQRGPPRTEACLAPHAVRQRSGGYAAAPLAVLARSALASYARPTRIEIAIPTPSISDWSCSSRSLHLSTFQTCVRGSSRIGCCLQRSAVASSIIL